MLLPQEQWDIHQYCQIINTGNDANIVETRTTVNLGEESLPQCAGRAYAKLFDTFQQIAVALYEDISTPEDAVPRIESIGIEYRKPMARGPATAGRKQRRVTHRVQAIMNPKFDVQRYADVLLMLAEHHMNEERKAEGKKPFNFPIHRKP